MRGQGAIEYIIILGVVIMIALVVVASLGGLGIFKFSTTAQLRATEILNQLSDVAVKTVVRSTGAAYVSIRSNTNNKIIAHSMSWYNSSDAEVCIIDFGDTTVGQSWTTYSNTSCPGLSGKVGEAYSFTCTIWYIDAAGIKRSPKITCEGYYE